MNPIKALVQRFAALPLSLRMQVTKRMLELSSVSDQGFGAAGAALSPPAGKSFLEEFWDEVERAHGDDSQAVNPFTQARASKVRDVEIAPSKLGVYLPLIIHPSKLLPLI
jgi:hypothetical protein